MNYVGEINYLNLTNIEERRRERKENKTMLKPPRIIPISNDHKKRKKF
jgi:hypothetical protein